MGVLSLFFLFGDGFWMSIPKRNANDPSFAQIPSRIIVDSNDSMRNQDINALLTEERPSRFSIQTNFFAAKEEADATKKIFVSFLQKQVEKRKKMEVVTMFLFLFHTQRLLLLLLLQSSTNTAQCASSR